MTRLLHALLLNAALIVGSAFYLLSPAVYAFFSEVGMTYSLVPRWFATTMPAQVTAEIFDRYNADAPRAARFRKRLSCYLVDEGPRMDWGCAHRLAAGAAVHGPEYLKVGSGDYLARFEFAAAPGCSAGEVTLDVVTEGRFGRQLAHYTGDIDAGKHVDVPFRLGIMDAALGAVEFRAAGRRNCVVLSGIDWIDVPAPPGSWRSDTLRARFRLHRSDLAHPVS